MSSILTMTVHVILLVLSGTSGSPPAESFDIAPDVSDCRGSGTTPTLRVADLALTLTQALVGLAYSLLDAWHGSRLCAASRAHCKSSTWQHLCSMCQLSLLGRVNQSSSQSLHPSDNQALKQSMPQP